jgi:UDPglucose 6-dehydrogenase
MYKIAIVGTGYVGLVTGASLSDFGMNVICVDNDSKKIEGLKNGIIPIYEPGLAPIVERNAYYKRLDFTTDIKKAIEECQIIFIAVGTPPQDDGSADLKYVEQVAEDIGKNINEYKVIVNKSTVPVGTAKMVRELIEGKLKQRGVSYQFDVVSNPEFLREGTAVHDFCYPDRVVIGSNSQKAIEIMKQVYNVLYLNDVPFMLTNNETAEMIKYASNAFLAMKITFINEIANLCEKLGANVQDVADGMGKDKRISPKFLQPGPGYGGSCFPKDTIALANMGKQYGIPVTLIEQTVRANENQKKLMAQKIENMMGDLNGKVLAILGLAFKPNTDDMREAASITILNYIIKKGAKVRVYDPAAMEEAKWRLSDIKDKIKYCKDEYEAINKSNGVVILTEWDQFKRLDIKRVKEMLKEPYFFDFRNIYKRAAMEGYGFKYIGVGQ